MTKNLRTPFHPEKEKKKISAHGISRSSRRRINIPSQCLSFSFLLKEKSPKRFQDDLLLSVSLPFVSSKEKRKKKKKGKKISAPISSRGFVGMSTATGGRGPKRSLPSLVQCLCWIKERTVFPVLEAGASSLNVSKRARRRDIFTRTGRLRWIRWQRSSSRVTEIDFGWWRCNSSPCGRRQPSTVATSSRGKPEKSTPRGPTWMWVRSSLSRVPLSAARSTRPPLPLPLPLPPRSVQRARPLFFLSSSSPPPALLLRVCIDNAVRIWKKFPRFSLFLLSRFTREWLEERFFLCFFELLSGVLMIFVVRVAVRWTKIGVEKKYRIEAYSLSYEV